VSTPSLHLKWSTLRVSLGRLDKATLVWPEPATLC